jgi:hypothetical protein
MRKRRKIKSEKTVFKVELPLQEYYSIPEWTSSWCPTPSSNRSFFFHYDLFRGAWIAQSV